MCNLTLVCCFEHAHVACDGPDPVDGAVRLEHLKIVPADVGMDVGWYEPIDVAACRFEHRVVVKGHERDRLPTSNTPISDTVEQIAVVGDASCFGRPEIGTDFNYVPQIVSDSVQLDVPLVVVLSFSTQRLKNFFEVRVLCQLSQLRNDGTALPVLLYRCLKYTPAPEQLICERRSKIPVRIADADVNQRVIRRPCAENDHEHRAIRYAGPRTSLGWLGGVACDRRLRGMCYPEPGRKSLIWHGVTPRCLLIVPYGAVV